MAIETPADQFTQILMAVAKELKAHLSRRDVNRFNLQIEVSGYVHDAETRVEMQLSESGYDGVKGIELAKIRDEFLRRFAWKAQNPIDLIADQSNGNGR